MTDEQLEFTISQYLDGSLSPDEATLLEAQLEHDESARKVFDEYRLLDTMLKAPIALPDIAWDKLCAHMSSHVSSAVAGVIGGAAVAHEEQFEFAISQYADGTLDAAEATDIEARLEAEPGAQAILADHRRLTQLLRSPVALPPIRWGALADHLCSAVRDVAEPRTLKLFARPWVRGVVGLVMAACLLLASAFGIQSYLAHQARVSQIVHAGSRQITKPTVAAQVEVQIGGSDAEAPSGSAVAEISIGAGPDAPADDAPDGIFAHSPRSLIASSATPAQDSSVQMPY